MTEPTKITDPKVGSVVMYQGRPVYIVSGIMTEPHFGSILNEWTWCGVDDNAHLGAPESGEGDFYVCTRPYAVKPRVEWGRQ